MLAANRSQRHRLPLLHPRRSVACQLVETMSDVDSASSFGTASGTFTV